jgi:hypothetical protein
MGDHLQTLGPLSGNCFLLYCFTADAVEAEVFEVLAPDRVALRKGGKKDR